MNVLEDQARSLFLAALERTPDQWRAFLDQASGGNAELRARVEQLLHAHQAMGSIHGGADVPAAARCKPVYESIRQTVGQSDWVVPDETGWRVGGYPAWLHTLVGPEAPLTSLTRLAAAPWPRLSWDSNTMAP